MKIFKNPIRKVCAFVLAFLVCSSSYAHNGKIAYAYPLGDIKVDGNLNDWPKDVKKFYLGINLTDSKPKNDADFSGFFQLGYRLENRSLYVAFTITDEDFIEDTSENVAYNTQDCFEKNHLFRLIWVLVLRYGKLHLENHLDMAAITVISNASLKCIRI
jgi:uncharacterized membrane protein